MPVVSVHYGPTYPATPDSQVEHEAAKVLRGETILTSTELVVLAVRVLVAEGKIAADDVGIYYQGKRVEMDDGGRIDEWPDGFCDTAENLLSRLFGF